MQFLYQKKTIPQINLSQFEDHKYLGVWEFYRRLHAKRYANQEDMALSFLALVDLTFLNDPNMPESEMYNDEEKAINSSLPYRFGKIIYRAQGVPPLDFSSSIVRLLACPHNICAVVRSLQTRVLNKAQWPGCLRSELQDEPKLLPVSH